MEEHLDHLQALGVGTVYLTPVFPEGPTIATTRARSTTSTRSWAATRRTPRYRVPCTRGACGCSAT
ncbi:hypothetical protein NKG05_25290 [Oerskovia sp. M15]